MCNPEPVQADSFTTELVNGSKTNGINYYTNEDDDPASYIKVTPVRNDGKTVNQFNLNITTTPIEGARNAITFISSGNQIKMQHNTPEKSRCLLTITDTYSGNSSNICVYGNYERGIPKDVRSITLDKTSANVSLGSSLTLNATLTPAKNLKNSEIIWTSENPYVAEVNNGTVTGIKKGTTTIRATATNGTETIYDDKTATCTITVNPVNVSSVNFTSATTKTIGIGETYKPIPTIMPTNATDKTLTWSSNKPSVATVSSDGTITGKSIGEAIITAKSHNNKKASITVKVEKKTVYVKSLTPSDSHINLVSGVYYTPSVDISPSNADNKTLKFTSSNPLVITIKDSETGKMFARQKGTSTITVETLDGSNIKTTFTVSVITRMNNMTMKTENGFTPETSNVINVGKINWGAENGELNNPTLKQNDTGVISLTSSPSFENLSNYDIKWDIENKTTGRYNEFEYYSYENNTKLKLTAKTKEKRLIVITATDNISGKTTSIKIWFNVRDTTYENGLTINAEDTTIRNNEFNIWMGKPFNKTDMITKFGSVDFQMTHASKNGLGDITTYVFTRDKTYKNYLEIIVLNGRIQGWWTNAEEKFTYKGIRISDETRSEGISKFHASSTQTSQVVGVGLENCSAKLFYDEKYNGDKNIFSGIYRDTAVLVNELDMSVYDTHAIHVMNAIAIGSTRHGDNTKPAIEDNSLKPAIKDATDWWCQEQTLQPTGISHIDKNGRKPNERLSYYGISGSFNSEITLIRSYGSSVFNAQDYMAQWWRSPGHKTAIINNCSSETKTVYAKCYTSKKNVRVVTIITVAR